MRKKPIPDHCFLLTLIVCLVAVTARAEETVYHPKSQIFSIKSEIVGGEFNVTNVIPLHGNFSEYRKIEIVHLKSLVGKGIPDKVLESYNEKVFKEFQRLSKSREVAMIDEFHPDPVTQTAATARDQDSLDGPMLSYKDLLKFDQVRKQKEAGLPVPGEPVRTLVIAGEVLDYLKGNHVLQFLPFNIGSTIFTIRFRYYDSISGEEIGRQIITGEVSADTYAGFVGLHSALAGVVEGLADQVERRVIESER